MKNNRIRIFSFCWITYAAAYLCRVNMSTVIPKLGAALSVTTGHLGFAGSLFFISYAIGQLINGITGDRVSPYKFLILALTGTMTLNFIISVSDNFIIILICWTLNGYFQSMFWGPLMRILSNLFPKERNADISMGMTASMVFGYIMSWTVLGSFLIDFDWNFYFLIPALCALPVLFPWIFISLSRKKTPLVIKKDSKDLKAIWKIIVSEKLYIIVFVCVCLGLVKESVSLWAPVILIKLLNFDLRSSFASLCLIPIANFGGIIFSRFIIKKFKRVEHTLMLLFGIIASGSLLLFIFSGISNIACVITLAIVSAMSFGCNSLLLSFIPLSYAHKNIVSTLVGIFDFSSYTGAAISAFALGIILSGDSWEFIPLIWLIVALTAVLLNKFNAKKSLASTTI